MALDIHQVFNSEAKSYCYSAASCGHSVTSISFSHCSCRTGQWLGLPSLVFVNSYGQLDKQIVPVRKIYCKHYFKVKGRVQQMNKEQAHQLILTAKNLSDGFPLCMVIRAHPTPSPCLKSPLPFGSANQPHRGPDRGQPDSPQRQSNGNCSMATGPSKITPFQQQETLCPQVLLIESFRLLECLFYLDHTAMFLLCFYWIGKSFHESQKLSWTWGWGTDQLSHARVIQLGLQLIHREEIWNM